MAPANTRERKENKAKITNRKKHTAIKKAKKGSGSKKKMKERTFQHIEEVDKNFAAIHDVLVRSHNLTARPEDRSKFHNGKVGEEKSSLPREVTPDELSETVNSIASL